MACIDGETEACGRGLEDGLGRGRQRFGEELWLVETQPDFAIRLDLSRTVRGAFAFNFSHRLDFRFARDASGTANQPIHLGMQIGLTQACRRGHVELDREQHFVLVPEVHQWPEGQTFGRGEIQGAGGDSRR